MVLAIYNVQVARWELNAHHRTQIYLWEYLNNATYILELRKKHIFLRYIDDLFFIWTGTEQQLERFLEEINEVHPKLNLCLTSFLFPRMDAIPASIPITFARLYAIDSFSVIARCHFNNYSDGW